jgi:hypothetical protein
VDTGAFERPGFVALRGAVDTATAAACRELIWGSLARRGVRRDDPGRWPAHLNLTDLGGDAFGAAATAPALTAAYATGRAGDVFLCHPFIVPTATWPHRGTGPRMIARSRPSMPRTASRWTGRTPRPWPGPSWPAWTWRRWKRPRTWRRGTRPCRNGFAERITVRRYPAAPRCRARCRLTFTTLAHRTLQNRRSPLRETSTKTSVHTSRWHCPRRWPSPSAMT